MPLLPPETTLFPADLLDHTDDQIGRFIDDLAATGELDNTLVFVLTDNGASQEGGPFGVLHEMKFFNGILETPDEAIAQSRRVSVTMSIMVLMPAPGSPTI